MKNSLNYYEFSYINGESLHHHAYLLYPLLKLIPSSKIITPEKLKILDLGCGNGSLSQKIAQQGYQVTGVEESASGILYARQNFPECHFIQASLYNLPYIDLENSFDIVIAAEVIEHLLYQKRTTTSS